LKKEKRAFLERKLRKELLLRRQREAIVVKEKFGIFLRKMGSPFSKKERTFSFP